MRRKIAAILVVGLFALAGAASSAFAGQQGELQVRAGVGVWRDEAPFAGDQLLFPVAEPQTLQAQRRKPR